MSNLFNRKYFKNDIENPSWLINKAGYEYSSDYGFGIKDAEKAVKLSKSWKTRGEVMKPISRPQSVNARIPEFGEPNPVITSTIYFNESVTIHRAQLILNSDHSQPTDLEITLTAPSGTKNIEEAKLFVKELNRNFTVEPTLIGSQLSNGLEGELVLAETDGCDFLNKQNYLGKFVLVIFTTNCGLSDRINKLLEAGAIGVIISVVLTR